MSKISVDLTRCQGYGNCVIAAPAEFDLDDSSMVKLLNEHPSETELGRVREAVSLCPVQAIMLTDD